MAELFAYLAGLLLATGVYLVLQGQPVRRLFGVVLVGNAVNLGIMAMGRSSSTVPPVVPPGLDLPPGPVANPLPQALVLTALVISFGLTAFALALIARFTEQDDDASAPAGGPSDRPAAAAPDVPDAPDAPDYAPEPEPEPVAAEAGTAGRRGA